MGKPKSTTTRAEFGWTTVVADPKYRKEAEARRRQAQEITQKRTSELLSQAGDQPIVRRSNFGGACFWIGILVRETAKFYIYAEGCKELARVGDYPEKRIRKDNAHLDPCRGCRDHAQTNYPLG